VRYNPVKKVLTGRLLDEDRVNKEAEVVVVDDGWFGKHVNLYRTRVSFPVSCRYSKDGINGALDNILKKVVCPK